MSQVGARRASDAEILLAPAAELQLNEGAAPAAAPAFWEFPVLYPIDLTETHGAVVTLERLQEITSTYDPKIEMASLNFDHSWSGPSFGWCEAVELRGKDLWVRYVDIAPEAVEAVRSRNFTRRSAEVIFKHPVTGGWYLTGVALLGQKRPAVPSLPALQLHAQRTTFFLKERPTMPEDAPPPTPAVVPPPPPFLSTPEGVTLSTRLGQLETVVSTQALELAASRVRLGLDSLGARVTPAFRAAVEPLLLSLAATPRTVRLSGSSEDSDVLGLLLKALGQLPVFSALGAGELADSDPPAPAVPSGGLSAERLAQLEARFGYSKGPAFNARS